VIKFNKISPKLLVLVFFVIYFLIGIFVYHNYGISGDEHTERETSLRQYRFAVSKIYYIFTKKQVPGFEHDHIWYQNYLQGMSNDKYYGTFLQWPAVIYEHLHNFNLPPSEIYQVRHLLNFTYFFLATICFYLLLKKQFQKRWLALLGVTVIILTPRFFAESFYNNKDILFASFYIITIYFCQKLITKPTIIKTVLAGIILALASNVRVIAILIGLIYFLVLLFMAYKEKKLKFLGLGLLFISIAGVAYIAIHPTAWGQETTFIIEVLKTFSNYQWSWGTLYFGQLVTSSTQPWHFAFGYFWATTPIIYSTLIVVGIGAYLIKKLKIVKNKQRFLLQKVQNLDNLMLIFALAPILAVIILHSTLYQGWRHLYFIYFPLIYFLIYGFQSLKNKSLQLFLIVVLSGGLIINSYYIITHHPHQFIYYNPLVRAAVADNFERDYWGLTRKDLYQKMMVDGATKDKIVLATADPITGYLYLHLTSAEIEQKFKFVQEQNQADYASVIFYAYQGKEITNYLFENGLEAFIVVSTVEIDGIPLAVLMKKLKS
jgi:hypothetical protein